MVALCYALQTMYTIKQAAARTGLSIPIIRVWERRYGVVRPSRTAAGYRLYDDESIARLVAMRHLVNVEGWRPSQAAERVLAAGADLEPLSRGAPGVSSPVAADEQAAAVARFAQIAVDAFVAAALRLDVPAMERVLDESFAAQQFELAMERCRVPGVARDWRGLGGRRGRRGAWSTRRAKPFGAGWRPSSTRPVALIGSRR